MDEQKMNFKKKLTSLIVFVFAQVNNDLFGASVEHVEEFTMLSIEASRCEVVDTSQTIDQFP